MLDDVVEEMVIEFVPESEDSLSSETEIFTDDYEDLEADTRRTLS